MRNSKTKKLAIAAIFVALAVVGSAFISFPVFGSKCSPTQHMVNVLCAVFLGPWYGVGVAFCASLIRNLVGAGTLMAFPGSMIGALCCGLVFKALKNKNEVAAIVLTLAAEMLGTGVLGGLCAYPVATLFMDVDAASTAVTAYIIPFLISTVVGSVIAGVLVFALRAGGALKMMQRSLELR
ncbi:MAG TPA: energy coupling factor transporter S component ThiW [Candidatus Scatomorpha pullistercoris]|uniref:Energy coupling factor transporter S component ThiW n=1 Tax=Candidatus Scatomorpha pullistercoris TaxID=2840929 RepID=A0A9D1G5G3_9FIRM|nr:energy coupling factor transporter S component ThiW [Candidatus Scatomorpha pullistercoris]